MKDRTKLYVYESIRKMHILFGFMNKHESECHAADKCLGVGPSQPRVTFITKLKELEM